MHTGIKVDMTLKPANPGFGYQFQRIDLPGQPVIKADCDLVTDTSRGTTLEDQGAKVSTVEHVLAALVGMGIDNCLVEVNGPEIPIIDGSSEPFVEIIEEAGVVEQDAAKAWYSIDTNITHYDEKKRVEMVAMPAMEYKVTTLIDFNSPVLGTQHAGLKRMSDFKAEIAPCRTFCFLHELEMLLDNNLIKGGDINNAIVVVDKPVTEEEMSRLAKAFRRDKIEVKSEGYLNNLELRFPNEPARHKLLDVIGDLALIGYPVKGHIIANRPGHSSNVDFARKIKQYIRKNKHVKNVPVYNPAQQPIFNTQQIEKTLPHRYPFLLVDRILELEPNKRVVGIKNVSVNEPFFEGHFPGHPVMPGVLIIEAMAQVGGIALLKATEGSDGKIMYLAGVDNARFRRPALPGDQIRFEVEILSNRGKAAKFSGKAYIDGKVAVEADIMCMMMSKNAGSEQE